MAQFAAGVVTLREGGERGHRAVGMWLVDLCLRVSPSPTVTGGGGYIPRLKRKPVRDIIGRFKHRYPARRFRIGVVFPFYMCPDRPIRNRNGDIARVVMGRVP